MDSNMIQEAEALLEECLKAAKSGPDSELVDIKDVPEIDSSDELNRNMEKLVRVYRTVALRLAVVSIALVDLIGDMQKSGSVLDDEEIERMLEETLGNIDVVNQT